MRNTLFYLCCFAAVGGFFSASAARAAEPVEITVSGDWAAYSLMEEGKKICYMVSRPVKDEGAYKKRDEIFALITHRPAQNTKDVFSYIAGYSYKESSDAAVTVDSKRYSLFTQGDTAWAPDAATDRDLAKAIKSGSRMVVEGKSSRGTATKDTFSLKGATAAYEAISAECGV